MARSSSSSCSCPASTFQGVEGKMFSPMVITLMLALAAAFMLSLTFVPAMVALLVRGQGRGDARSPSFAPPNALYAPMLRQALAHPCSVHRRRRCDFWRRAHRLLALSAACSCRRWMRSMSICRRCAFRRSRSSSRRTSTSGSNARSLTLPEVNLVFSKAGTANLVFDAMPSNASDNYVMLKPKDQWPPEVRTKEDVLKRIRGGHGADRRKFL